jgi:hypothetical protein
MIAGVFVGAAVARGDSLYPSVYPLGYPDINAQNGDITYTPTDNTLAAWAYTETYNFDEANNPPPLGDNSANDQFTFSATVNNGTIINASFAVTFSNDGSDGSNAPFSESWSSDSLAGYIVGPSSDPYFSFLFNQGYGLPQFVVNIESDTTIDSSDAGSTSNSNIFAASPEGFTLDASNVDIAIVPLPMAVWAETAILGGFVLLRFGTRTVAPRRRAQIIVG